MRDDVQIDLEALEDLSPPIPPELVRRSRDEAKRIARRRTRQRRRRAASAAVMATLCTAFAFTAPGRAATGWLVDIAGLDESPTLPQVKSLPSSPRLLASGQLDGGLTYEVVAKRDRLNGGRLCIQVDWVGLQAEGRGGACTRAHETGRATDNPLENSGVFKPAGRSLGSDAAVFAGIANDRQIEEVKVELDAGDGPEEIETVLVTIPPRTGANNGPFPVTIFVAPLQSENAAALAARGTELVALAYDEDGSLVDRQPALLRGPTAPALAPLTPDPNSSP